MGRGGDQVCVLEGGGNGSCCHQAADMSHVSQQVGVELNTELKNTQTSGLYIRHLLLSPNVKEGNFSSKHTSFLAYLLHPSVV